MSEPLWPKLDGSEMLEIGKLDINLIYRWSRQRKQLISIIWLAEIWDFKGLRRYRIRKTTAPIRIKINNLISDLQKHTATYLVSQYKFLFIPNWETQQMVKNASVSLRLK